MTADLDEIGRREELHLGRIADEGIDERSLVDHARGQPFTRPFDATGQPDRTATRLCRSNSSLAGPRCGGIVIAMLSAAFVPTITSQNFRAVDAPVPSSAVQAAVVLVRGALGLAGAFDARCAGSARIDADATV